MSDLFDNFDDSETITINITGVPSEDVRTMVEHYLPYMKPGHPVTLETIMGPIWLTLDRAERAIYGAVMAELVRKGEFPLEFGYGGKSAIKRYQSNGY